MKNEYVGDINDFAKYALLGSLAAPNGTDGERLGVLWYLTPDEGRDGGHTAYLDAPLASRYAELHPELHARLGQIVKARDRRVDRIEQDGVLPASTTYVRTRVPGSGRSAWFTAAAGALADRTLVFLDPDNGLAPEATATAQHATEAEATSLLARGQSVVLIQFLHRGQTHEEQLREWARRSTGWPMGRAYDPIALRWRGIVSLGFLVLPATVTHATQLRGRVNAMLAQGWSRFFSFPPTAQ